MFALNTDGTGFRTLHNLGDNDGAEPSGGLLLLGSILYGTADAGGASGNGTVFTVNTDGTGFTNLHTFTADALGTNSDGAYPSAGLISSGNTLYGTTLAGGASSNGTVFKINADGTGFATLHTFTASSGTFPSLSNSDGFFAGGLTVSGNILYGATRYGGSSVGGTVFSLNSDGTSFAILHTFTAQSEIPLITNSDGSFPNGGLILSGGALYGTTSDGGVSARGTVFSLNTDGTGFTNLYSFTSNPPPDYTNSDGIRPAAGLILSENILYGTAVGGGSWGNGTVFALNTDGTGFTDLHAFTASTVITDIYGDGVGPTAGLVLSGNTLYGTAPYGGSSGAGTVFAVNTDRTGFKSLHSFTAPAYFYYTNSDGAIPFAGLLLLGETLYGTAQSGGPSSSGTVFGVNTDGTGFRILHAFMGGADGGEPDGGLISSGDTLYGMSSGGGISGSGTVFAVNTNGTGFRTLYTFDGTCGGPEDRLVLSSNILYGTAGSNVFAINTDGSGFRIVHAFAAGSGTNPPAQLAPSGDLLLLGNTLYGTTPKEGTSGNGTVFKVNTDGTGFTNLHTFTTTSGAVAINRDGAVPCGGLISSGNILYGTTSVGGYSGSGTVFYLNTDGTGFTNLYSFTSNPPPDYTNSDGTRPGAGLILSGNTLYGTTLNGGISGVGTVFSITLPPPHLTIIQSSANLILTWPTNATGFALQSTTNLGPSAAWSTNSSTPVVINGQNVVTNAISGAQRFYRLSE